MILGANQADVHDVWNACTGDLTLTNGSASVVVRPGEVVAVVTDGAADFRRVQATDFGGATLTGVGQISGLAAPSAASQAATKKYVDDTAFAMAGGALPGQAGNAGRVLTTDGTAAGWGYAVTQGAGLASVADHIVTVTGAAASDVRGGTDNTKAVTAAALMQSAAFQSLTDAATITWNCANGYNATVTLAGNRAIGAPTGLYDGLPICLELVQDGVGSRVPTWSSVWDFGASGTPVLQTAANKRDLVFAIFRSATGKLHASFLRGA